MILTGNDFAEITRVKQQLDVFKIKDLEPIKYFLGLEIACPSRGIFYTNENTSWS